MAVTLTQFTRTVDLSGYTSTDALGTSDPEFFCIEGTGSNFTYLSNVGFQLAVAGGDVFLCTAVPGAAFWDIAEYPARTVTVEWEQNVVNNSRGGVAFVHYSKSSAYGTDGEGYLFSRRRFTAGIASNKWQLLGGNINSSPTIRASGATDDASGWLRFRATITTTGATTGFHKLVVENWNGSAWVEAVNYEVNAGTIEGTMFGVAFMCEAGGVADMQVRGPDGAAGPVITFSGTKSVFSCVGQSEFGGRASTSTAETDDDDLMSISGVNSGLPQRLARPWTGANHTALADWSYAPDFPGNSMDGSFVIQFAEAIKSADPDRFGSQLWIAHSVKGATSAKYHQAPAMASRYDVATEIDGTGFAAGGCRQMATMLFGGDGQTTGQTVTLLFYQGTADIGETEADYLMWVDDQIIQPFHTLYPESPVFVGIMNRQHGDGNPTNTFSGRIFDVHNQVIDTYDYVHEWFNDEVCLGAWATTDNDNIPPRTTGLTTGWPNADETSPGVYDTTHPGAADYDRLIPHMVAGFGSVFGFGTSSGQSRPTSLSLGLGL